MKKLRLFSSVFIPLCVIGINASAQLCGPFTSPDDCKTCAELTLPKSTIICNGSSAVINPSLGLPAGFAVEDYVWQPGSGVIASSGWGAPGTTTITPPPPAGGAPPCGLIDNYYTLFVTALAQNLIVNGDFSLGNMDFCTTNTYVPPGTSSVPNNMMSPPTYSVCDNADDMEIPGVPCSSSSPLQLNPFGPYPGCPNMLLVYGDPNAWVYWSQVVNICGSPNQEGPAYTYHFSYKQATLTYSALCAPYTPVNSWVGITDQWGATTYYGPFAGVGASSFDTWYPVYLDWTNATGSSYVTISILSSNPYYGPPWGSLFAFDDIQLRRRCVVQATTDVIVDYSSISGPSTMCVGDNTTLVPCTPGGNWVSSDPSVVYVDPYYGTASAFAPGTAVISYTDMYGCTSTLTITVPEPAVACVTTACCDYTATFTSNCSTTPVIYYQAYAYGAPTSPLPCSGVGCSDPYTAFTGPGTIPWSTVESWFGVSAWTICVTGQLCNGCWSAAQCCAGVNPLHKPSPANAGNSQSAEDMKIVPNPNNGTFTLTGSLPGTVSAQSATVEITDLIGQAVYSSVIDASNGNVNASITLGGNIANGLYMVKVKNGDASKVIQFVLNR